MAALESGSLVTHDDLVRDQLNHPPLGSRRLPTSGNPVRTGITGTGDGLLVLTWSAAELERERAAGVRLLSRLGIAAGERIANALPGALATPGSLLFGDVVQDLGGLDVPVGAIENEAAARQAWTLIDLVEPAVLVLNRASAPHLLATVPAAERSWWQGILWQRIDTETGTALSLPEATGFAGWQRTWLAAPEATSFVAVSCASHRFHLDSQVSAEIIDTSTGEKLGEGSAGAVVLTPLGLEIAPLRYLTSFRGSMSLDNCPCGDSGPTLSLENK